MPTTSVPKFPVVDPEPELGKVIGNFNFADIRNIAIFSSLGYGVGFFGSSMKLRGPFARFNMGIGFVAGTMYACQNSMQRFMGLEMNKYEVRE